MRRLSLLLVMLAPLGALAQVPPPVGKLNYKIHFDPRDVVPTTEGGKSTIALKFAISVEGGAIEDPNTDYKIIVEENGHKVYEDDVPRPTPSEDLSVMLAIDNSGSMKEYGRIDKTRAAADFFLKKIPSKADCGLLLFDHEMIKEQKPILDRQPLYAMVNGMQPRGGTAFIDAASRGIKLLEESPSFKQRFLVLMTDGVDLNSNGKVEQVILQARAANVRIITIGIGEPGKQELVNTALVLDQSGSMKPPADNADKTSKIEALHRAASRFASIMPTTGWASVIPFSTLVGNPSEFTNDRASLIRRVKMLRPEGETALLDATYAGICTLDASGRQGRKAVIAMTDGVDNASRRRMDEVINRAKEAKVQVYTLGFGRDGELDQSLMRKLAKETGGEYYHARNEQSLLKIFEDLSFRLHDDGIDEITLRAMAQQTGGQYYPVKNIGELQLILDKVRSDIQHKEYKIKFLSKIQTSEGTNRQISLKLVRRSTGEAASNTADASIKLSGRDEVLTDTATNYQTRGLVAAEMHPLVYLLLLVGIGALLLLPSLMRFGGGA